MPESRPTRTRLHIAIAVFLLVDVAAAAMLLTPIAGRENLRQDRLRELWLNLKARESAPWRGLDKKIPQAQRDVDSFYRERFPSGYSEISTTLDKLAAESGVRVSGEKYGQKDADLQTLQRVEIEADVSGDYLPLVKFINSVERSKLFFVVDELDLGGQETGTVKLRIKLETYLRTIS